AHVPGVTGDRDVASLEGDPGPGGRVPVDRDDAAARGGPGAFGRVATPPHRPRLEVLAHRPADEALDGHLRAVGQARYVVPGVARDGDVEVAGQADRQVVPPARLGDADDGAVRQPAQRRVQLADRQLRAAELDRRHACHV